MVDSIKTTFSASANASVVKPQVTVRINRPAVSVSEAAPVRKSKPVDVSQEVKVRAAVVDLGKRAAANRPPILPRPSILPLSNSGLTTYRDQESGRVIIRVFDRETGDVLLELPTETQRSSLRPPDPPPLLGTRTVIDA